MHFRTPSWLLLLSLVSCGGKVAYEVPASSTADAGTDGAFDAAVDGANDVGTPPQDSSVDVPADTLDAIADQASEGVGPDATPDAPDPCSQDVGGQFTCCQGKPCRGSCMSSGCECSGIAGGCVAPAVCCGAGCMAPELCSW